MRLAAEIFARFDNVDVERFDGLMVDFARQHGASLILRGLRAVTDFEYEFQLAGMNRKLFPEADTIFFPTSEKYTVYRLPWCARLPRWAAISAISSIRRLSRP